MPCTLRKCGPRIVLHPIPNDCFGSDLAFGAKTEQYSRLVIFYFMQNSLYTWHPALWNLIPSNAVVVQPLCNTVTGLFKMCDGHPLCLAELQKDETEQEQPEGHSLAPPGVPSSQDMSHPYYDVARHGILQVTGEPWAGGAVRFGWLNSHGVRQTFILVAARCSGFHSDWHHNNPFVFILHLNSPYKYLMLLLQVYAKPNFTVYSY